LVRLQDAVKPVACFLLPGEAVICPYFLTLFYCHMCETFILLRAALASKLIYFHHTILFFPAMTTLTASVCWNVLAHKTDEVGEVGVKIYQKPESNDIYGLRRRKNPPLCKENENPDAAW